ncbi:MAG: hypothetical protein D084_Lepto4C00165G0002 [Leptospirillum sp. Group IV 'UBA BS']|nr:MAG: hypothetical protein D084_Lepto4C00165G0002 [Leptospirillum sp. Group IV 'UBA BS']
MKQPRSFDIPATADRARKALNALRDRQKPGERAGKGSKTDVIRTIKSEIQTLLREGFTAQQIAEAFREDVFSILPKTITQVVGPMPKKSKKPPTERKRQAVSPTATIPPGNGGSHRPKNGTDNRHDNEPQNVTPGSFHIHPDSEDL